MISFAFAWAFLALPLPVLAWWLLPPGRARRAVAVPDGVWHHLQGHVAHGADPARPGLALLARGLGWVALIVALAGPGMSGAPITERSGRDLILAVDVSASMSEPLADGTARLDHVRAMLVPFAEARRGDRLGLIGFGESAHLIAPLTHDTGAVAAFLDELGVGLGGRRTDLGQAAGLALRVFGPDGTGTRAAILVTDGETNTGDLAALDVADLAALRGVTLHILGVDAGANPETAAHLTEVAGRTGGQYLAAGDPAALAEAAAALAEALPRTPETRPRALRTDLTWVPLVLALGALGWIGWQEARG